MKEVFRGYNPLTAQILAERLRQEGIPCELRNAEYNSLYPGVAIDSVTSVYLWVQNDEDEVRARALIETTAKVDEAELAALAENSAAAEATVPAAASATPRRQLWIWIAFALLLLGALCLFGA